MSIGGEPVCWVSCGGGEIESDGTGVIVGWYREGGGVRWRWCSSLLPLLVGSNPTMR